MIKSILSRSKLEGIFEFAIRYRMMNFTTRTKYLSGIATVSSELVNGAIFESYCNNEENSDDPRMHMSKDRFMPHYSITIFRPGVNPQLYKRMTKMHNMYHGHGLISHFTKHPLKPLEQSSEARECLRKLALFDVQTNESDSVDALIFQNLKILFYICFVLLIVSSIVSCNGIDTF